MNLFEQVDLIGTVIYRFGRFFHEFNGAIYEQYTIVKIIGDRLYLDDGNYILKHEFDKLQGQEIDIFKRIFTDKEKFDNMLFDLLKNFDQRLYPLSLCC